MTYSIKSEIEFEELEKKLRQVILYNDTLNMPYSKAKITQASLNPSELKPLQKYLMKDRIESLRSLKEELLEKSQLDIAKMTKGYVISDGSKLYGLIPPIVEVSYYDAGKPNVILDGIHRCWLALEDKERINVILIDDVDLPLPAFPNSWEEIRLYDSSPQEKEKREYRCYDRRFYQRFRRDLNSVFNTGGRR